MPTYPGIEEKAARTWVDAAVSSEALPELPSVKTIGTGEPLDLESVNGLDALAHELIEVHGGQKDAAEGELAVHVLGALGEVPMLVLDDPAFWRWLGIVHLWDFVVWREAGAFQKDAGKYLKYVDGHRHTECVAMRMYLRAKVCEVAGDV